MNNPYSWNSVNPDLCYGRDGLLSEMLSGLPGSPRFSFGLAGGRRMGKTTFLRRIQKELSSSIDQWRQGGLIVVPVYIDGLALPETFTPSYIWTLIAQEIARVLDFEKISSSLEFDTFKATLQSPLINSSLRPRIIVLFDEVERIVAAEGSRSFFNHWRALLNNSPDLSEYFTAVFSGAREMAILRQEGWGSPLKDILEWRNLQVLEYEDSCRLMQKPIKQEWPENILRLIYEESGGHPMLIQYIMQYICSSSEADTESAVRKAVNKFSKERSWQFSEWWNKYCDQKSQQIYAFLPDDGSPIPLAEITREFGDYVVDTSKEVLKHVGLITEEDDGYLIRYTGKMFRRWYNEHKLLSGSLTHKTTMYSQLSNLAGPAAAQEYVNAWNMFRENIIDNQPMALEKMRNIFEQVLDFRCRSIKPDGVDENLRPRDKILIVSESVELDQPMQLVSNYELLSEINLKFRVEKRVQNAPAYGNSTLTAELNQLMKQWEDMIVQLVEID